MKKTYFFQMEKYVLSSVWKSSKTALLKYVFLKF
jgi:hypothetical protein